ncbi:MAG: hypothetical protein AB1467_02630 [Candidatus Diapherotrites archaeon]
MVLVDGTLNGLGNSIIQAATELVNSFFFYVLGILAIIILLIIGWIIGRILKEIVVRVLVALKVDDWFHEHNLMPVLGGVPFSAIVGTIVKWYTIALFLAGGLSVIAVNVQVLSTFFSYLVYYIPSILAAGLFMALGFIVARYCRNQVDKTSYTYKNYLGLAIEIIIMYVSVVLALSLVIGVENVQILIEAFKIAFTVFAVVLAVIFGITFALAFKKDIKSFANDMKKDFS